jgi:hypothetical protein
MIPPSHFRRSEIYTEQPHYSWFVKVGRASFPAGTFAVLVEIYRAGRTGIALAFILVIIVFMPLFVFLP